MEKIIEFIQIHDAEFIIILAVILIADIAAGHFIRRKKHVSAVPGKNGGGFEYFIKYSPEVFIIIEKKNFTPVLVSENIKTRLGISDASVYSDIELFYEHLPDKDVKILKKNIDSAGERTAEPLESRWENPLTDEVTDCEIQVISGANDEILINLRDISREKLRRDELTKEVEAAKKSEASKTTFLSNMSHEIRTPLNGMLGMIQLAKMNMSDTQAVSEYLDKADSLSKFLLSVINDILDMSRIESGRIELESAPFDIRETARALKNMFKTNIEDKGIKFEMEIIELSSPYVLGDELRISQVITNFLSNALKFTPEGGKITLTFRQMDEIEGKVSLMIRVADTGKGMTSEFLHNIFQPFVQEDSGIARHYGGSGLGMAIADNLVSLMNGQILVDSEPGKGSAFTVFITLPEASQKDIAAPTQDGTDHEDISLEGKQLLMAEDQQINAMIVVKMLSSKGLKVDVAENGVKAVAKFSESIPGYYDAILMDIQMPEMDGWEATRRIRALDREDAKEIPIFALSADAFVEDKRRSAEMGMNGHITKPIDYAELDSALKKSINERNMK